MAATILTTANRSNWETQARIRLIGADDTYLIPSATLTAFVDEVERVIKKKLVDAGTTSTAILAVAGDDKENLISATLWLLCAKLCDPLARVIATKEKEGELSYEFKFNPVQTESDCYSDSENCLMEIATYAAQAGTFTRYATTAPTEPMFESMTDD